jgi:hypothetical protein
MVKKCIVFTALILLLYAVPAEADETSFIIGSYYYNVLGVAAKMDVVPFIDENGRTMIPVRYLAYAVGIPEQGIFWKDDDREVYLFKENTVLSLKCGENLLTILQLKEKTNPSLFFKNPDEFIGFVDAVKMDTVPVMINDRVFLPARYVAEYFGYEVQWQEPKLYLWPNY